MAKLLSDDASTASTAVDETAPHCNGLLTKAASEHLVARGVLEDLEPFKKKLHTDFHCFAERAPDSDELMLSFKGLVSLTNWLAVELDVDTALFGEMSQMFWRFDFTGDGMLSEAETTKLMLCMLRSLRDAAQPPVPGSILLGDGIERKVLHDEFTVHEKIGEGGQGTVFRCSRNRRLGTLFSGSSQQMVLKMFDKSNPAAPLEDIAREYLLLTEVKHPQIAHVFEIFQDVSNIYVVQEPYMGGDLSTAVQRAAENGVRVNERWLAGVTHQVVSGTAFLHSRGVMHCDIKEPNVMLVSKAEWDKPQIVLIDFGLANKFATRSRPGGTPGYMPPEVWESGLWTPRGDVFSIGVLMFSMRTGMQPFTQGCKSLLEIETRTTWHIPEMEHGSAEMKSLVYCMMDKNFRGRPMTSTILKDPWFSMADVDDTNQTLDAGVLASLTRHREQRGLRKAVLADLASRENLAQMKELNQLFLQLDTNGDGVVSAADLRLALTDKWPEKRINELVQALLGGEDGEVSYEEFMGQLIAAKEPVENELLWRVFTEVDRSKKGYLDQDDIKALLERPAVVKVLGGRDPAVLMRQMSRPGTNKVTFKDFKIAIQGRDDPSGFASQIMFAVPLGSRGKGRIRWQMGEPAEYFSYILGDWASCTVTAVDPASGAVQVDWKPRYWLHGLELFTRLRRPHTRWWLGWLNWTCLGARSTCGKQ